jgi:hypothetical protein
MPQSFEKPKSSLSKILGWVFEPPKTLGAVSVIAWWELRRIPFNVFVGIYGLVSLVIYFTAVNRDLHPGEDAVEPLVLVIVPILINIFYTSGWMTEILVRFFAPSLSRKFGPFLLKMGVTLSLCIMGLAPFVEILRAFFPSTEYMPK